MYIPSSELFPKLQTHIRHMKHNTDEIQLLIFPSQSISLQSPTTPPFQKLWSKNLNQPWLFFPSPYNQSVSRFHCLCLKKKKKHPESDHFSHHLYCYLPWSKPPSSLFQIASLLIGLPDCSKYSNTATWSRLLQYITSFHSTIACISLRVESEILTLHSPTTSPTSSLTTLAVTIHAPATQTFLVFLLSTLLPYGTCSDSSLCVEHSLPQSDILRCLYTLT